MLLSLFNVLTLANTTCYRSGAISAHADIALWDSFKVSLSLSSLTVGPRQDVDVASSHAQEFVTVLLLVINFDSCLVDSFGGFNSQLTDMVAADWNTELTPTNFFSFRIV